MQNFLQRGDTLTVPAPVILSSGAGVKVGAIFGIAATDAQVGDDVALSVVGVFTLPKAANAFAVGDGVYWDATAGAATSTVSGNTRIGVAINPTAAADATADVRLNGTF